MTYTLKNNSTVPAFDPYQNHMEHDSRLGGRENRGKAEYTPNLNNRIIKQNPFPYSTKVYAQGGKLKPEDKFYGNIKQNNALNKMLRFQKLQTKKHTEKRNTQHIKKEKKLHDLMTQYFKGEISRRSDDKANQYLRSQMTKAEREVFDNAEVDKFKYMKHLIGTNEVAMADYRTKQEIMDYFSVQNPAARKTTEQSSMLKDIADGVKTLNKKPGTSSTYTSTGTGGEFLTDEFRERGPRSAEVSMDLAETGGLAPSASESLLINNPSAIASMVEEARGESSGIGFDLMGSLFDDRYYTRSAEYMELGAMLEDMERLDWTFDNIVEMYPDVANEFKAGVFALAEKFHVRGMDILTTMQYHLEMPDSFFKSVLNNMYPSEPDHTQLPETSSAREILETTDHTTRMGEVNDATDGENRGPGTLGILPTSLELALGNIPEQFPEEEVPLRRGRGRPVGSRNIRRPDTGSPAEDNLISMGFVTRNPRPGSSNKIPRTE